MHHHGLGDSRVILGAGRWSHEQVIPLREGWVVGARTSAVDFVNMCDRDRVKTADVTSLGLFRSQVTTRYYFYMAFHPA